MQDKAHFRAIAREVKKTIDFSLISDVICQNISNLNIIQSSTVIMLYMALADEVNLLKLYEHLKSHGKSCCFPVVYGDVLYTSDAKDGFKKGSFGILEPFGDRVNPESIDLVIVPGVMFDTKCRRLGRGKGYYDKFLDGLNAYKIGVCPDKLLVGSLPCEKHDLPMDMVITEKRMIFND